jgi:hypothetical protein
MQLVALCGAAGAGKTTTAQLLVKHHGFVRMRFADTLKDMLRVLGLTDAQIEGEEKERPCKLLGGLTPRAAMQTLGTEWGRKCIGEDIWCNALAQVLDGTSHRKIVIDDCRYSNEVAMIHRRDGVLWRVRRPAVEPDISVRRRLMRLVRLRPKIHTSELLWPTFHADRQIMNEGNLADLALEVRLALHCFWPERTPT